MLSQIIIHCQQIISVVSTQISFPFHLPIHRSLLTTGRKISLFAYNFEIRKNYLKSLFHFLKLEESIIFFLLLSLLEGNADFFFSSRNWRNFLQISLFLLDWSFLPLVNHWWCIISLYDSLFP